ncbi:MAG TPA: hypothetical protein VIC26_04930 [Marinagarivorans sp.]
MARWYWLVPLLLLIAYCSRPDQQVTLAPGVMVAEVPAQTLTPDAKPFRYKHFTIKPLADFDITAKVLSKKRYWLDDEADLSPIDFALGWQHMSDEAIVSQLAISQSYRWFRWSSEQLPIALAEIQRSAANMHLIPADDAIRSQLFNVPQGSIVNLKGRLVEASASNGMWRWRSSLTREDTGSGACELFWVERVIPIVH